MKLKLQDKEFSYIKTEALYFLEPILSMLDMLQVFSKEPKKYIQVDLKNLKFENFDGMKKRLEEVIHTDFKEDKLENIKEQYENLLLSLIIHDFVVLATKSRIVAMFLLIFLFIYQVNKKEHPFVVKLRCSTS